MDNGYNLDNLEALFKKYLLAGINKPQIDSDETGLADKKVLKTVSIKNYLSDLRHFLGWLIFYLKSRNLKIVLKTLQDQINLLKQVRDDTVEEYKSYLTSNNIPQKTINRRLSSLRRFFSFSISQGLLTENPAKKVSNIKDIPSKQKIFSLIQEFKADLLKENISQKDVNSCLKDIEEFFSSV